MTTYMATPEKMSKQGSIPKAEQDRLDPIFRPKSVAVIGASNREGSVGNAIFKNILMGGYCGTLYPVNPKAPSINGVHAYTSVTEIPGEVDLALIIVPAPTVCDVLEECGKKGVRGVVIVTAGFKEIGPEGAALEKRAVEIARQYNMPLVGPNCLGVINTDPDIMLNASFGRQMPKRGNLAFISQSGALCAGILDYARGRDVGFSKFISVGNKADVTELDLVRYLATEDSTEVILMYLETLVNGRAFIDLAREVTGETDTTQTHFGHQIRTDPARGRRGPFAHRRTRRQRRGLRRHFRAGRHPAR